jgi:hypothetical protein
MVQKFPEVLRFRYQVPVGIIFLALDMLLQQKPMAPSGPGEMQDKVAWEMEQINIEVHQFRYQVTVGTILLLVVGFL